jgi:hypothetical protein
VTERPGRPHPQVVSVQRDIERPDGDLGGLGLPEAGREPPGQRHSPGRDAEQDNVARTVGALEDLVANPCQRPADLIRSEHRLAGLRSAARASAAARRTAG